MRQRGCRRGSVAGVLIFALGLAPTHAGEAWLQTPPGTRVDIGTHRLYLSCRGAGSPTVVMDSGLGGTSLEWLGVQERVAARVKACVYDRAGYGWSEPGPQPRTSSRIADELFVLLKRAGVAGPYVLVGHSFGGFNVRLFANRYPYTTAGVVLVDSSHPEQVERFLQPPIRLNTAPSGSNRSLVFGDPKLPQNLPEELRGTVLSLLLMRQTKLAMANEYLNFRLSASEVHQAGPLPKVPMVVLSRGKSMLPLNTQGLAIEKLWSELQNELSELSPYSALIVADRSGHHVHVDQPQLVADAIFLVVDVARRSYLASAGGGAAESTLKPLWLAFKDATWRSDRLHTQLRADPFHRGRLAQNGSLAAGRIAGPIRSSLQPVEYLPGTDLLN